MVLARFLGSFVACCSVYGDITGGEVRMRGQDAR